jgi:ketosteroid isomerase-like protein
MDEQLTLLLEERAILRALNEYAHAMDYADEQGWVDSFTPDAVFDVYRAESGETIHRENGHGDLAAYIGAYPKPPAYRKHIVVDPLIEIDGDRATVVSYWLLLQRDDASGGPVLAAFGRYRDTLRKHEGTWRIAERTAEVEAM